MTNIITYMWFPLACVYLPQCQHTETLAYTAGAVISFRPDMLLFVKHACSTLRSRVCIPHPSLRSILLQDWQGVQTIPRVVTYDADLDELVFYPIVEVELLRTEVLYQNNVTLNQVLLCCSST